MPYALGRIVNIWMGLYYNLSRIRAWSKKENILPTIEESLDYLEKQQYRYGGKSLYYKMRSMFKRLRENGCNNTVSTLEFCWKKAISSEGIEFDKPTAAVSLYDFPRFMGASWPHNDIALYLPSLGKTAIMKISDSRFEPLRQRLMVRSQGMDPFIGTRLTVEHSKLYAAFSRIRCSKAIPINPDSLNRLPSFREQLSNMDGAYILTSELKAILEGGAPMDLEKFVVARYGNGYALMQFVVSDVIVKDVVRFKDWNHYLTLEVDGFEAHGWMSRDALFDPVADPVKFTNKKARIGGFVLIGRSAIEDYRASIHLISISALDGMSIPTFQRPAHSLPLIKQVEEEMLALTEKMLQIRSPELEVEKEIQDELITTEEKKQKVPTIEVRESGLPEEQGRILVIVSSDRKRGFRKNEILIRLHHEGVSCSSSSVAKSLEELCKKEYLYMNIFGDVWFLNPFLKVVATGKKIDAYSVAPRILEYLKKVSPRKIHRIELIKQFTSGDSRLNSIIISKTLNILTKSKLIHNHRNKYSFNEYPPRQNSIKREKEPEEKDVPLLTLNERQVEKIPDYLYVAEDSWVNVFRDHSVVKKVLVRRVDSRNILTQLINDVKKGRYTNFDFEDQHGGLVKILVIGNKVQASYEITSRSVRNKVEHNLTRVHDQNEP